MSHNMAWWIFPKMNALNFKTETEIIFYCFSGLGIVAIALTVTQILAEVQGDAQSLGQQCWVAFHPE